MTDSVSQLDDRPGLEVSKAVMWSARIWLNSSMWVFSRAAFVGSPRLLGERSSGGTLMKRWVRRPRFVAACWINQIFGQCSLTEIESEIGVLLRWSKMSSPFPRMCWNPWSSGEGCVSEPGKWLCRVKTYGCISDCVPCIVDSNPSRGQSLVDWVGDDVGCEFQPLHNLVNERNRKIMVQR